MSRWGHDPHRARLISNNTVQHSEIGGSVSDWWIRLREKCLNRVSGIQEKDVLNVITAGSIPIHGKDPAAELKRALDSVKDTAMNENGDRVDYASLKHSSIYQDYHINCSPGLMRFDPTTLKSRGEQLAFWINLYNVLVIDAVIALGIQRSVIEGLLGMLSFFRRAAYNIGGLRINLDEIEHGILRGNRGHPYIPGKQFTSRDPRHNWVIWPPEPRIHFALNCASRSCPPIQVYSADHLDVQLDLAARNFVDANVRLDQKKQSLVTSSLFKWFMSDFDGRSGVIAFLIDHLPDDQRQAWITEHRSRLKLRFEPYNWDLNLS
ncbi:MAG: DUF547 domain-containing protein [Anaerolineales bacterium]